ncbi:adenylyl-sulfate kinase 3-like [Wolffia australiana]
MAEALGAAAQGGRLWRYSSRCGGGGSGLFWRGDRRLAAGNKVEGRVIRSQGFRRIVAADESGVWKEVDLEDHDLRPVSTVGRSTNIAWHECPVGRTDREKLLGQKGCVIWITGLSGSGKSTLACALSRSLFSRGRLSYVLDGDNVRHGLNKDLSFKPEDRAENIRRIGEVAKFFADAGIICIASLISPYRKDRNACRDLLPQDSFIEVFLDIPLEVCEARDVKGLYKLARAGKIKGFTGIDDPYERPLNCEILIEQEEGICPTPDAMADQVVLFLDRKGFLRV